MRLVNCFSVETIIWIFPLYSVIIVLMAIWVPPGSCSQEGDQIWERGSCLQWNGKHPLSVGDHLIIYPHAAARGSEKSGPLLDGCISNHNSVSAQEGRADRCWWIGGKKPSNFSLNLSSDVKLISDQSSWIPPYEVLKMKFALWVGFSQFFRILQHGHKRVLCYLYQIGFI